jgi:hypothetical protein
MFPLELDQTVEVGDGEPLDGMGLLAPSRSTGWPR